MNTWYLLDVNQWISESGAKERNVNPRRGVNCWHCSVNVAFIADVAKTTGPAIPNVSAYTFLVSGEKLYTEECQKKALYNCLIKQGFVLPLILQ